MILNILELVIKTKKHQENVYFERKCCQQLLIHLKRIKI